MSANNTRVASRGSEVFSDRTTSTTSLRSRVAIAWPSASKILRSCASSGTGRLLRCHPVQRGHVLVGCGLLSGTDQLGEHPLGPAAALLGSQTGDGDLIETELLVGHLGVWGQHPNSDE